MPDINSEELRKLLAEATPGPWEVSDLTPSRVQTDDGGISISWTDNSPERLRERRAEANAALIVAAVNYIRDNIDHLAEMNARRVKAEDRATAAERSLKAAMEALEPFGCYGAAWIGPDAEVILKSDLAPSALTVGTFRRAASVLKTLKGEGR